ncbi:suppressor of fused domain protein [Novosphingobium sp.]|uniref:suppressor of fused domain protein n=1 Tax=Novosphingobium sp. TaxID=1874826 RepID=UPI002734E20A|nr:suppressor of fused domain protein [Novosphingobium sp.]
MTTTPSNDSLKVFAYLEAKLGESSEIIGVGDSKEVSKVDIMAVHDRPEQGVKTYATLDFATHDIGLEANGKDLRVELVMACGAGYQHGAHILASCAFEAMNDGANIGPGEILEDVVALYHPDFVMQHAMLVDPFLWDMESQQLETRTVAFLQIIPISTAEADYAEANGPDALQDRFVAEQIDVYDLERSSVI